MSPKAECIEPHFLPLGQIVSHNAERFPEGIAMTQGKRKTSWTQFDLASNQVANGLISAGIPPGARVAYLGKTTDQAFQVMHGCAKACVVFTPVNWRLAAPEVAYILQDAEAQILFAAKDLLPLIADARDQGMLPGSLVLLDCESAGDEQEFSRWCDRHPSDRPGMDILPEDIVLQLYTSGTTGRPKGALITQDYVMNAGQLWHAEEEDAYDMLPGEEHLN